MSCRVCRGDRLTVLIDDPAPGLTSLAAPWPYPTVVHFCADCGHLSTESTVADSAYYEHDYDTVSGEDDDLMYVDEEGLPVYRIQQQSVRMLELVEVGSSGRVLDFGCGHGVFMRRFLEQRPQWNAFGFEVSDRYAAPHVYIGELPEEQFDLITSFYVFEHVDDPVATAVELRRRLSDGGSLFLAVPDTVVNPIDVLAADHLSHFGHRSLDTMFERSGLAITAISRHLIPGTWLVAAQHAGVASASPSIAEGNDASDLGRYWTSAKASLEHAARTTEPRPSNVGIYGAGVYGAYMKSRSGALGAAARCFVDSNRRKQGTTFQGLPVLGADGLDDVDTVLVGLRPDQAEALVATPRFRDRRCICLPVWAPARL